MLRPPLAELSLALVGDRRMSALHEQFLNLPGPTDVLTFPLETDRRGRPLSGEVVVCVPEARRRARELGTDERREALLYALHGMLHLGGFDDRTPRGYRTMHATEDAILSRLGVGPVFAPARPGTLSPLDVESWTLDVGRSRPSVRTSNAQRSTSNVQRNTGTGGAARKAPTQ